MVVKPPVARRGCAVDGRCCAQRAVHLGRMCRKRGVWGEVDDVVSVGSRCWGRVVGPRQCGRLRQRGRPGWRRRCEGWLGQGRIDAGYKKAGPRRVPPHCCRGQAADAPGSSYTYAELTTLRAERCCVASECGIGEHTRQRVRELIRTLLSVPQGIDAVVARGFCH